MILFLSCLAYVAVTCAHGKPEWIDENVAIVSDAEYGTRFPYVARLFYGSHPWCSASIIHERWALTAAHCVHYTRRDMRILVGTSELTEDSHSIFYTPETMFRHEAFRFPHSHAHIGHIANDIALIRLDAPIVFSTYVQPIRVADYIEHDTNLVGTIVGFGTNSLSSPHYHLPYGTVRLTNVDDCRQYTFALDTILCGSFVGSPSTCTGYSGGPFVADGLQMGIISTVDGEKCAFDSFRNVFIKVSSFRPWIQHQMSLYGDVLP